MATQAGRRIRLKGNYMRTSTLLRSGGVILAILVASPVLAEDPPAAAPAPAATPAAPTPFIKFSGHAEIGMTAKATDSARTLNWGHLFTDRSTEPLVNQVVLTAQHDIDSSSKTANWGFKVQGMWGSDARYTHTLGILNNATDNINQFDIVEAHVDVHLPIIASGGVDVKAGIYPTLEGVELIDATGNFFYSHNYIFNFGIPLKHTGIMTTTHFSHGIDIYLGVDSGVNTSFGTGGDTNGAAAFHGGIGFTIGKNVTVLATTHIGPENPRGSIGNYNKALRYLNDVAITWKISPKLTSSTDINYIRDDGFHVAGGGISEQLVYAQSDAVSWGVRAEVWSDGDGFFVAAFPGNHDFVAVEKGMANTAIFAPAGGTTYGAVTVGVNFKPKVPAITKNFSVLLRPEVRYDASLGSSRPFGLDATNTGTKKDQLTLGIDAIFGF